MQLLLFSDPVLPLIRDRLIARNGRIDDNRNAEPTDQLILSLIGSDTSDRTARVAFEKLRLRFPSWTDILAAAPAAIATTIADVKHAAAKAEHLKQALQEIAAQHGTLDLGFLAGWPAAGAWPWLQTLPGVGPKVAAATLNFSSLRKPVLVVDRHVLRVGKRLGLLPPKADFRRGHRLLNGRVPNDWDDRDHYQLHWLMKFHGQTICRASTPHCGACPLTDMCRTPPARIPRPSGSKWTAPHVGADQTLRGTGNAGDVQSIGDGVSEMRFRFGPGYRVYYLVLRRTVVLLGGDKSTQAADIRKAKQYAEYWKGQRL